jgi:hypothetical protein
MGSGPDFATEPSNGTRYTVNDESAILKVGDTPMTANGALMFMSAFEKWTESAKRPTWAQTRPKQEPSPTSDPAGDDLSGPEFKISDVARQKRAGKPVTKRQAEKKRYWRITGTRNLKPSCSITDERLKDLLRCQNARANNFPFAEIVGAYMKKGTRSAHGFLEPRSSFPQTGYWCANDDAQFVAIIVDETGIRVTPSSLPFSRTRQR